jgi:hypothetical protein
MPSACIVQPHCRVSLKSERLELFGRNEATDRDEILREIPIRDLDRLLDEIDEEEDRVVAYKIDARSAKETLTAGRMVCSEKAVCYLV